MGCCASKKVQPAPGQEEADAALTEKPPGVEPKAGKVGDGSQLIDKIAERVADIRTKAEEYRADLQAQAIQIEQEKIAAANPDDQANFNGVVVTPYVPESDVAGSAVVEAKQGEKVEIIVRDAGGWAYCRMETPGTMGWVPSSRIAEIARVIADHKAGVHEGIQGLLSADRGEFVEVVNRHYSGWAFCREWPGPATLDAPPRKEGWVTDSYLEDNRSEVMLASKWHRLVLQALDQVVLSSLELEGVLAHARSQDWGGDISKEWQAQCMEFTKWLTTELQNITEAVSQHEQNVSTGMYAVAQWETIPGSSSELKVDKDDVVLVLDGENAEWAWCRLDGSGDEGWVPKNILKVDDDRQDEGAGTINFEDLPSWVKEGNRARWWSMSGNRFCDVKISKVDRENKEVTVVFAVDDACWKCVNFDHFALPPEEWLLHAQEDKAQELVSQLPQWVQAGAAGAWWSASQQRSHNVVIKQVCTKRRAVIVNFEIDRKVKKSVPFHDMIDDPDGCLLQKSERDHRWRLKKQGKKKRKRSKDRAQADVESLGLEGLPSTDDAESLDAFIMDDDDSVEEIEPPMAMSVTEKDDFRREALQNSFKKTASKQLEHIFNDMQQDLGDMLGPEAAKEAVESGKDEDVWKSAQLLSPTAREVRELQSLAEVLDGRAPAHGQVDQGMHELKLLEEQAGGATSSGRAAPLREPTFGGGGSPARPGEDDRSGAAASAPSGGDDASSESQGVVAAAAAGVAKRPDRQRSDSLQLQQLSEELADLTAESPRQVGSGGPGVGGARPEGTAADPTADAEQPPASPSFGKAPSIEEVPPQRTASPMEAVGIGGAAAAMRAAAGASDAAPVPPSCGGLLESRSGTGSRGGGSRGGGSRGGGDNRLSTGSVAGESTVGELRTLGRRDDFDALGQPLDLGASLRSATSAAEYTQSEQGLMEQLDVLGSPGRDSTAFFNTQERRLLEELDVASRSSSKSPDRRQSVEAAVAADSSRVGETDIGAGSWEPSASASPDAALAHAAMEASRRPDHGQPEVADDSLPAPGPPPAADAGHLEEAPVPPPPPEAPHRSAAAWGAPGDDVAAAPPPPRRVAAAWGDGEADAPAPPARATPTAAPELEAAGAEAEAADAEEWRDVSENAVEEMREVAAAFGGGGGVRVTSLFKQAVRAVFPETWDSEGEGRYNAPPDVRRLEEQWPELEGDLQTAADASLVKLQAAMAEDLQTMQEKVEAKIEDVGHKLERRARQTEAKLDPAGAAKYRSMQWTVMNEGERVKEMLGESVEARMDLRKKKAKCQKAALKKALSDPAGALASVFLPDSACLSGLLPAAALQESAEAMQELYRSVSVAAIRPADAASPKHGRVDFLGSQDLATTTPFEVAGEAAIRAMGGSLEALAMRLRRERDELPQKQSLYEELEFDNLTKEEQRDKKMFEGQQEFEWNRTLELSIAEKAKRQTEFFHDKLRRVERVVRRRCRRTRDRDKQESLQGLAAFGGAITEVEQQIRTIYRENAEKAEAEVERVEAERRKTQEQTHLMLSAALVIREEKEVMNGAWYSPPKERQAVMLKCLKRVRRLQEDMKVLDIMPELKQKHSVLLYSLRMLEAKLKGECQATPNDILEGQLKLNSSQKKQLQDARKTFEEELAADLDRIRSSHASRVERMVSRLASGFRQDAEAKHVRSLEAARLAIDASVSASSRADAVIVALRPFADAAAVLALEALRHDEVAKSPLDVPGFIPKQRRFREALDATLKNVEKLQGGLGRQLEQLQNSKSAAPDRDWETALSGAEKRWRDFCERFPDTGAADGDDTPRSQFEVLQEGARRSDDSPAGFTEDESTPGGSLSPKEISPSGYVNGGRGRRGGNAGAAAKGKAKAKARARGNSPQGERPERPSSAVPNGRPPSAGGQPPAAGAPKRIGFQAAPPGMKGSDIGAPGSRAKPVEKGGGGDGSELLAQLDELSQAMDKTLGKTKTGGFGRAGGRASGAGGPPPSRPSPPQRRSSREGSPARRTGW